MARKSFEQCIESIVAYVELRKYVDYGDRKAVRKFNNAYDRIVKMTIYIEQNYPERIEELISLIYHTDPIVAYTCACVFITNLNGLANAKLNALSVVKKLYSDGQLPPFSTLGLPIAIEEWERKLGIVDR